MIQDDTAYYLKLRVARTSSSAPVVIAFELATATADSLRIPWLRRATRSAARFR